MSRTDGILLLETRRRIAEIDRRMSVHGMTLFPYQRKGVEYLGVHPCAGLWDEMGLGKTPQAACAFRAGAPVLVVCPTTVKYSWAETVRLWRPEFAVTVIDKKASWRWPRPGEVVICGYEILPVALREIRALEEQIEKQGGRQHNRELWSKLNRWRHLRARLKLPHAGTQICSDEAHRVKNKEAAVTLRFRELSVIVRSPEIGGGVWLLTGTPQKNTADELWVVLQGAGLGVQAFGSRGQFDIDLVTPGEVARKLSTVSLMRLREDVLPDLPAKTRERVLVELDPDTAKLADELVLQLRAVGVDIHTATLDAINSAIGKIDRSRVSTIKARLAQAKIPALLDLVADAEAQGVPLVVFSDHRGPVDACALRDGWTRVSGIETAAEKQRNVQAFQDGRKKGVAVSIRAGGVGITLTRGWMAIFTDYPWVPADVSQAEDRLCRIGQKAQGLLYKRLVARHVLEERIDKLLEKKQKEIDANVRASAVRNGRDG